MILQKFHYGQVLQPRQLVLMLHGYGANGKNLLELACELQKAVPQALFISVNAVEPWEGGFPDCYQWFSLYSQNL
jgi:phospholipase/carboxylesterase